MSGDAGLHDESIIFYSKKMTQAKLVLLAELVFNVTTKS